MMMKNWSYLLLQLQELNIRYVTPPASISSLTKLTVLQVQGLNDSSSSMYPPSVQYLVTDVLPQEVSCLQALRRLEFASIDAPALPAYAIIMHCAAA
jgi:hypothetical protein